MKASSESGRPPVVGGRTGPRTHVLRIAYFLSLVIALDTGREALCAEAVADKDVAVKDIAALGERLASGETRTVRLKAALALGKSGDIKALEHLFPAIDDEDLAVRKTAAIAVASVLRASGGADPARLVLNEALSAKLSPGGQLAIVGILGNLSPPKDVARAIVRFVDRGKLSEESALKCVRIMSGERFAGSDVVRNCLLEQLEKGDVTVAAAAASALTRMDLSEREKAEVVETLVGQLNLEGESAPIREAATKALGAVTGEGRKSRSEWRAWAVKEGYGDPVERIPEDDLESERLPVIVPPVDTGASPAVSSLIYVIVGLAAAAFVVVLLVARSTLIRRSAAAIEARRQKARRRF